MAPKKASSSKAAAGSSAARPSGRQQGTAGPSSAPATVAAPLIQGESRRKEQAFLEPQRGFEFHQGIIGGFSFFFRGFPPLQNP